MKKILFLGLGLAVLALAGCQGSKPQPKPPVVVTPPPPPVQPPYQPPPTPPTLPPPEAPINWMASVQPLVNKMVSASAAETDSGILLLNQVKNNTSGSISTVDATDALKEAMQSNSHFELVPESKLNEARQALGLQGDDSLISRAKAVSLARYLGAKYVVYTSASGNPSLPEIMIQLLQTSTGEIIWSGQGNTQR
ncbi:penicillin-binding protein activator LpoB [Jinshanibacter sp. LJY008]|uniref:Penicillin-binding protein activator LpoB n=1 Tax=Limnobaculum eriocheiris TaxID=2897391 RepID=A0A9X1MYU2_9GAMM|nr:penicillin-binding protein activator LpoB [Limnobaculum eriocheiris]MCD1127344.1 penicillin-binding protein activator LpoB [Limnobaculum eriocheiris]